MSACISRHGEFSAHTPDDSHACTLCGVLDEDALRAELEHAQPVLTAARDVVKIWRQWQSNRGGEVIPIKALAAAVDVFALAPLASALSEPVPSHKWSWTPPAEPGAEVRRVRPAERYAGDNGVWYDREPDDSGWRLYMRGRPGGVIEWLQVLAGAGSIYGGRQLIDATEERCASCEDKRWVDDEGWQPAHEGERAVWRVPGAGLIPCGACNHGGWDVPVGSPESGARAVDHDA